MSFSSSDDDSQQRFALGFLFALIALVVSIVVGVVVYKRGISHAPVKAAVSAPAQAPVTEVAVVVTDDAASVRVEGDVVTFYFASGKTDVAQGASNALADVVQGVAAGKKALVSGFHDATGSADLNAELSKQRALAVRDALLALGVAEASIQLKKPEETQLGGPAAEARRVEVVLEY